MLLPDGKCRTSGGKSGVLMIRSVEANTEILTGINLLASDLNMAQVNLEV